MLTRTISVDPYTLYLRRTVALLSTALALAILLYGTFLLLAVIHTASHTAVQREISSHISALSDLETAYLAATEDLTLARAQSLGLTTHITGTPTTVYTSAGARSLSLRTQQ